jgi:ParB family chromosome partitioning protein
VYELTFRQLEQEMARLSDGPSVKTPSPSKPKKIQVTRKIGARKLSVSSQGGKLTVSAAGLQLDKQTLEGLSDVIATYLEDKGLDGTPN